MKKFRNYIFLFTLLIANTVYSAGNPVFTIYSDSTAPCFKNVCSMLGIYIDASIGYSWLNLSPYRLGSFTTMPLGIDHVQETTDSFLAAFGYDFYPCTKVPIRLELNYFYADANFKINSLFLNTDQGFYSRDRFLVENTMATLYFDWHTCTRFVPYAGISAGFVSLQTYHNPKDLDEQLPLSFKAKENNLSWGGTIGSRYFFSNSLFANLQLRFTNLGNIFFNDLTPETLSPFPERSGFKSDYVHEATIMFGLGYVF